MFNIIHKEDSMTIFISQIIIAVITLSFLVMYLISLNINNISFSTFSIRVEKPDYMYSVIRDYENFHKWWKKFKKDSEHFICV